MNTSTSPQNAKLLETRHIWAPTITEAMELAHILEWRGWRVQGHPSPMIYNGVHGTGVFIARVADV
jgi:hypothetical protein